MLQDESELLLSIVVNSQALSASSPSHLIVQSFANLGIGNTLGNANCLSMRGLICLIVASTRMSNFIDKFNQ